METCEKKDFEIDPFDLEDENIFKDNMRISISLPEIHYTVPNYKVGWQDEGGNCLMRMVQEMDLYKITGGRLQMSGVIKLTWMLCPQLEWNSMSRKLLSLSKSEMA